MRINAAFDMVKTTIEAVKATFEAVKTAFLMKTILGRDGRLV